MLGGGGRRKAESSIAQSSPPSFPRALFFDTLNDMRALVPLG